jgi:hypothetical protein
LGRGSRKKGKRREDEERGKEVHVSHNIKYSSSYRS